MVHGPFARNHMVHGIAIGVALLRSRLNGAKCDSLGPRPRNSHPAKTKSPNGAKPTASHRVVPPHWGFSIGWPANPGRCPGLSPCGPLARNRMVHGPLARNRMVHGPFARNRMVHGIAIGVVLLRFRPSGAKCESLGQRPRNMQPRKNQKPQRGETNGITPRCSAPLGLFDWVARKPRAMPWAITLWAFGPESHGAWAFRPEPHGAWDRNRRCTLAIPPQRGKM